MYKPILLRAAYLTIAFGANILLANLLKPELFGSISLLIINAAVISLVTGFGVDSFVMYSILNKKWSTAYSLEIVWKSLFFQLLIFIVLEILAIMIFEKTLLSANTPSYFFPELLYFFGLVTTEKYLALFYSVRKEIAINLLLTVVAILYGIALLLCTFFFQPDYQTVFGIFSTQAFLQGSFAILLFRKFVFVGPVKLSAFRDLFKVFRISSVVMLANSIQFLAYRIDFFFIKFFYSDYEVGLYAQANKFANLIWIVPNIVAPLFFYRFREIEKENIPTLFRGSNMLNFLVAFITIFATEFCYALLLHPSYRDGIKSFYLMLPGYIGWALVIYFAAYFSSIGKFMHNLISSLSCFILILLLDVFLIPRYGINGAALANTVSFTVVLGINFFFLLNEIRLSPASLFVIKRKDFVFLRKLYTNE